MCKHLMGSKLFKQLIIWVIVNPPWKPTQLLSLKAIRYVNLMAIESMLCS